MKVFVVLSRERNDGLLQQVLVDRDIYENEGSNPDDYFVSSEGGSAALEGVITVSDPGMILHSDIFISEG